MRVVYLKIGYQASGPQAGDTCGSDGDKYNLGNEVEVYSK